MYYEKFLSFELFLVFLKDILVRLVFFLVFIRSVEGKKKNSRNSVVFKKVGILVNN